LQAKTDYDVMTYQELKFSANPH